MLFPLLRYGLNINVKLSAARTPVQRTDIVAKITFVFLQHASCYSDAAAGKFILILFHALMWTTIVGFTLLLRHRPFRKSWHQ
jgi:hypothetical protein